MSEEDYLGLEPLEEEAAAEDHPSEDDDQVMPVAEEDGAPQRPEEAPKEEYGAKVQKRIDKLVWEKKSLQEERDRILQEKQELEGKWAEAEAEKASQGQQQKIDEIKAKIKEAFEEGDTPAMIDLQDQLSVIRSETMRQPKPADPQPRQEEPSLHPEARAWLERNPWYHSKPRAAKVAMEMEADLLEQGYEYGGELYQELDRRLEAAGYRAKPDTTDNRQGRSPVGGARPGYEGKEGKGNKITKSDLDLMRKYGFDPNSAGDRKAWLDRNKSL